ncbi:MAG: Eco57I restriction-modification methylase domain-containing protein [Fimbriimonadaceae bacterium]
MIGSAYFNEVLIGGNAAVPAEKLAVELGWVSLEEFRRDTNYPGCLLLGRPGDLQCAIQDSGDDATALAYHLNIEWLLDLRAGQRRVINTRYKLGNTFCSFGITPENLLEIESHFTPQSRLNVHIEAPTLRQRLLESEPIDSIETALIKKLAEARRIAAATSKGDPQQVDQDVHLFISQLFVLRAIEDLQGYANHIIPHLEQYIGLERGRMEFLDMLFQAASEKIETALFEDRPYQRLSESAIQSIIESLYAVKYGLGDTRLNFGWIHPDVFGRVYERYTATVLAEGNPPIQSSLFGDESRPVAEHSVRKQRGVYYTPWPIVHLLVRHAMDTVTAEDFSFETPPRIADLTCGSGAFLLRALDELIGRHPLQGRSEFARKLIQEQYIVGMDIDSRVVALARILIYLRLLQEGIELPLPTVSSCVVTGDALAGDLPDTIKNLTFDAVVGNPPFVPHTVIQNPEDYRSRFVAAKGRFDYSSLFVERGLKLVKEGGAIALVIPNRLFTSASGSGIRDYIKSTSSLELLVDFGSYEVFSGVSAYIGLLGLKKGNFPEHNARIIQAYGLTSPSDLWLVQGAVFAQNYEDNELLARFDVSQYDFGDTWHFQDPKAKRLFQLLNRDSVALNEVAMVRQGIKTGANSVFMLDRIDEPGSGYVKVVNEEGRQFLFEERFLRPTASGSEIERYRSFEREPSPRMLLMPYNERGVVAEDELREVAPRIYEYLVSQRLLLESRASIRIPNRLWYEFASVRDEEWRTREKLLTRDLVPSVAFALDETGAVHPVGGTSIIPADPAQIYTLAAILNSSIFDAWLSRQSSAFKGSFYKIEPGRLAAAPVPLALIESVELYEMAVRMVGDKDNSEVSIEIDHFIERSLEL